MLFSKKSMAKVSHCRNNRDLMSKNHSKHTKVVVLIGVEAPLRIAHSGSWACGVWAFISIKGGGYTLRQQ